MRFYLFLLLGFSHLSANASFEVGDLVLLKSSFNFVTTYSTMHEGWISKMSKMADGQTLVEIDTLIPKNKTIKILVQDISKSELGPGYGKDQILRSIGSDISFISPKDTDLTPQSLTKVRDCSYRKGDGNTVNKICKGDKLFLGPNYPYSTTSDPERVFKARAIQLENIYFTFPGSESDPVPSNYFSPQIEILTATVDGERVFTSVASLMTEIRPVNNCVSVVKLKGYSIEQVVAIAEPNEEVKFKVCIGSETTEGVVTRFFKKLDARGIYVELKDADNKLQTYYGSSPLPFAVFAP